MQETRPVACTLTDLDLRDRRSAWLKVGQYAIEGTPITGGMRFRFTPAAGVEQSLSTLIKLEAECCEWMTLKLTELSDGLTMSVTALGDDGQFAVREIFAPLLALVRGR